LTRSLIFISDDLQSCTLFISALGPLMF